MKNTLFIAILHEELYLLQTDAPVMTLSPIAEKVLPQIRSIPNMAAVAG
jgi:hypothetical protein